MGRTGRAAFAEFLAAFAFVFVAAGIAATRSLGTIDLTGSALAEGFMFGGVIVAAAAVSGGHVNPAVTIGMWASGKAPPARAVLYVAAQLTGAVVAALLLRALLPTVVFDASAGGGPSLSPGLGAIKGVAIEAVMTTLLVLTFIAAVGDERGGDRRVGGLAVGLVLVAGILTFGTYTGAALNPARWLGPALAAGRWVDWYVWLAGPLLGGLAAGLLYRVGSGRASDAGPESQAAREDS